MESEKLQKAWESTCTQIKSYESIDQTQINAFFSRLHPQALSEGFLMLTAENDFIKTWIELHYITFIKQALQDIYGVPFTVLIEVDASETTPVKASIPATAGVTEVVDKQAEAPVIKESQKQTQQTQENSTDSLSPQIPYQQENSKVEETEVTPISNLTFENFVIGDSNRMAYSMAVAVAESPGKAQLNPLFIYGKSGLGKTHLLRAIQNYIHTALPIMKTYYVDSAELLSDYMEASAAHDKEKSSFKNFKTRYENVDVLLIDDVQHLQGKKQTLDIVFQIFNKLTNMGKQVVLAADRAPKNIDIDERYKSRFNSGGTFDIQPPEIETKLGVVKSFIEEYCANEQHPNFTISQDIQRYIAEISSSNIRELKSAVTKVIYQMTYFNQPDIELEDVRHLLDNHFSGGLSKRLTVGDIQKEVENFYKINHTDLVGKKRNRNIMYARQVGIFLCRQLLDLPYNDIGKQFNRDHSTVMYSINCVEERIKENYEYREEVETIKQIIKEN
ncbi:MAG: chromosomal replication initiator protein DnaA [Raoultibacter sp.]